MINKANDIKFVLIQVVLTLFIAFIPIYFYIQASFENKNIKDRLMLKNYAASINYKIKAFEKENSDFFYYPRSNIFTSAIYDQNNNPIFSLLQEKGITFNNSFYTDEKRICYKEYLQNNILGASYLTVCKDINNSQVLYNVVVLLLTVACLIFLSSFFIIKQSIEPYKRLNKYLDDFLKDAMHELKTPIGVARINADLLQMKLNDNKHLQRIKSALKNMTVVYEDLEYFIQSHIVKETKKNIDLSFFLKKRIEFFNDLSTAKNIKLITYIEENIKIIFNEVELYRLIDNNISNAIKYSKEGSFIELSLKKEYDDIILSFKDNGIGIKDINKIFDRYYRGDKISGGFGIGLNIVKNICLKNNIEYKVDSTPGTGSVFKYIFKKGSVQNSV